MDEYEILGIIEYINDAEGAMSDPYVLANPGMSDNLCRHLTEAKRRLAALLASLTKDEIIKGLIR